MAFLVYFFVLLVSAGAVLFGLDLVNSPLHTPNVPIGRTVRHVGPPPPAHAARDISAREATAKIETKDEAKKQQTAADSARESVIGQVQAENRSPNPDNPASPGPAAPAVTAGKASADETQAAASDNDNDASDKQDGPAETAQADAQQASAPNACNVQACSSAYRSFRASDCTYQPYDGPRRLCTKSGGGDVGTVAQSPLRAQSARRAAPRYEFDDVSRVVRAMPPGVAVRARDRRGDELGEVERIVRRMTRGRSLGDVAVQLGDGRIVIVHTGDPLAE